MMGWRRGEDGWRSEDEGWWRRGGIGRRGGQGWGGGGGSSVHQIQHDTVSMCILHMVHVHVHVCTIINFKMAGNDITECYNVLTITAESTKYTLSNSEWPWVFEYTHVYMH